MKTITLINWVILSGYALILLWLIFFTKAQSDDRMAKGLLMLVFIPLAILAGLNFLPYQVTKILTLVLVGAPIPMYLVSLLVVPLVNDWRSRDYDQELRDRANGSYYFNDPVRQALAAALADRSVAQLKLGLSQPVPDLNKSGDEHQTLLDFAAIQAKNNFDPETFDCLELLMAKGATIETNDVYRSATHFLVLDGDPLLLEWFLKHGADANAKQALTGKPILFEALYISNHDETKAQKVRLLLEYGADPNSILPRFDERVIVTSALLTAAENELWEICLLLLDKGADPTYQTESGWTIYKAVDYQLKLHTDWGKVPAAELAALQERLLTLR